MATLKELRNEKTAKSNELADIFDSVEEMSELTSDQKEEIKSTKIYGYGGTCLNSHPWDHIKRLPV